MHLNIFAGVHYLEFQAELRFTLQTDICDFMQTFMYNLNFIFSY
jgi:hypothetical protein